MDNEIARAAMTAALLHDMGDEVTPTKLAAHICVDSFELYGILRDMDIMRRGTGVRGSTKNTITEKAKREGLMVVEMREGKRYGKELYEQPLFTEKGAAAVFHAVLGDPPPSLLRAKRLISIMLLADAADYTPVAVAKIASVRKYQDDEYVTNDEFGTQYRVKGYDPEDDTYLLGGEHEDFWEGAKALRRV